MRIGTSGTEPRHDRHAGFTLFELLAVLTIIALAATVLSFGSGRSFGVAKFRAVLTNTSAMMRHARAKAMGEGRDFSVVIDLRGRRVVFPATGESFDIPGEVDLVASVAESEHYPDGTVGVRFFGDGSSTGGILDYSWRNQKYKIDVNWLTGHVAIGTG